MSWFGMNHALSQLVLDWDRYLADPSGFLQAYELTEMERAAIERPDIQKLWDLRVQPYILRGFQRRLRISEADFHQALAGRSYQRRLEEEPTWLAS